MFMLRNRHFPFRSSTRRTLPASHLLRPRYTPSFLRSATPTLPSLVHFSQSRLSQIKWPWGQPTTPSEEDQDDNYDSDLNGNDLAQNDSYKGPVPSFDFIDPGPVPLSIANKIYPTKLPEARKILKQYHGYSSFRGEQERVIARLHHKGPTIYMMPTGGGKSLVYQILARTIPDDGVIVVVEPLVSLLRDQVKAAQDVGLAAEGIDGTMTEGDIEKVYKRLRRKKIRMLYVSPERLNTPPFLQGLSDNTFLMLVIDEAHLIPLEGPSYRPSLLDIPTFYQQHPPQRILLTTATATEQWLQDLARAFQVPKSGIFRASVYRPNLSLLVKTFEKPDEKGKEIVNALRKPGTAITYVAKRKLAEKLAVQLQKDIQTNIFSAYHARINSKVRNKIQEEFTAPPPNKNQIVATKAFGMGLNKSDVRQIVHHSFSPDPAQYLQEIGRAGRDGLSSKCLTLFCQFDAIGHERKIRAFLPTSNSIYLWLNELSLKGKRKVGARFEYDLFKQARRFDIEHGTIAQLYKILELREGFRYIKPVSLKLIPHEYKIRLKKSKKTEGIEESPQNLFKTFKEQILKKDQSIEAKLLLEKSYQAKSTTKWFVDPRSLTNENVVFQDLNNKLLDWDEEFKIKLLSLGGIEKFKVIQAFPTEEDELKRLANRLHDILSQRLNYWLDGLDTMVSILEMNDGACIAARLTGLFGSKIPDSGRCGKCTACIKAGDKDPEHRDLPSIMQPPLRPFTRSNPKGTWHRKYRRDLELFERVYEAVVSKSRGGELQYDAEFLTKLAYGTRSPRLTAMGLSSSKISGSLGHWPYNDLFAAFKLHVGAKKGGEDDFDEDDEAEDDKEVSYRDPETDKNDRNDTEDEEDEEDDEYDAEDDDDDDDETNDPKRSYKTPRTRK